jgi:hypothetical protein
MNHRYLIAGAHNRTFGRLWIWLWVGRVGYGRWVTNFLVRFYEVPVHIVFSGALGLSAILVHIYCDSHRYLSLLDCARWAIKDVLGLKTGIL